MKQYLFQLLISGFMMFILSGCHDRLPGPPNILLCIADDVSFPHMGEGCKMDPDDNKKAVPI